MIRFEGVGLHYVSGGVAGPAVLCDADWAVPQGGFRWLRGASGAGKTSVLKLLALSLRPSVGTVVLFGTDVAAAPRGELPAMRRRIGVIYQDFRLLPDLSVFDNVALPLRILRAAEDRIAAEVRELLAWVGLAGRGADRPASLSGGEQQRVAIARAVIHRPDLLLADEPTGNLDAEQAARLMGLLRVLHQQGTTVVVATHADALVAAFPAPAVWITGGRLGDDAREPAP